MFSRPEYLNQLIDSRDNQTVKVITGIRRSGKSYLLNEIYRHYLFENGVDESHLISVSLDLAEYADLRDPRKLQSFLTDRIVDNSTYYPESVKVAPTPVR